MFFTDVPRPGAPSAAQPARDDLLGRRLTVLVAYGDFGHAVVDGSMWTIRHALEVMHPGDTVYVVQQRPDLLVVDDAPRPVDDGRRRTGLRCLRGVVTRRRACP